MRVNPNLVSDMLSAIGRVQQQQATALLQISTGKRVNIPSDDPSAAAGLVENHTRADQVDQYTRNGNTVSGILQTADSVLSSVVSALNQAISVGVEGASGTLSDANRNTLAAQVRGTLESIVTQANTSYRGIHLFAGTDTTTIPFTPSTTAPSGYQYNGNSGTNSVAIGDGYQVQVNLPGDQLFQQQGADVLDSLQRLVSSLQSGDSTNIGTATNKLRDALDHVTQQRAFYGNAIKQINSQESFLRSEVVNVKSEENSLVGIDLASAAARLTQAQNATQATLAATARILPTTLLDYLR